MNIIQIIVKEFKQNIRNWKANMMMILFPIVLIIILGAAFSGVFDNKSITMDKVKVLYTIDSSKELGDAFRNYTSDLKKQLGIEFEETDDFDRGLKSIKDTEYSCYVRLTGNPDEIKLYKNERYNFEANMVQQMLKVFSDRYSAIAQIFKTNPAIVGKIMSEASMDFVKIEALNEKKAPGSMDYYAVTMLTLIIMYSSLTGLWAIKNEQTQKTGSRMLCSPVTKSEILVGKVIGGISVTVVQVSTVILFSKFVLKANWGSDILTIIVLVVAESLMAISIGTGIAYLIKNDGAATGIINTIIPVIVLFGGGYMPIEQMGPGLAKITFISPLRWVNDGIFRLIYNNDYSYVPMALLINLAVAAAFLAVSAVLTRKEAV